MNSPLHGLEQPCRHTPDPAERVMFEVTPAWDHTLAFRIPLPRGWDRALHLGTWAEVPTVARPIGMFVSMQPPGTVAMAVMTTPMPIEVRVEDWVRRDQERAGWTVLDQRWHDTPHGLRCVTWATQNNLVRGTVAFADAGRLYTVNCQSPLSGQAKLADLVWASALALALELPAGPGRLEARHRLECDGHHFEVPASWEAEPTRVGRNAVHRDVALIDPRGPLRAKLRVRVGGDAETTLDVRRRHTLARLAAAGWAPSRAIDPLDTPWYAQPGGWEARQLTATSPLGEPFHLRVTHGTADGIPVEAMVAGSTDGPTSWMRAVRALEIAIESLEVHPTNPHPMVDHPRRMPVITPAMAPCA